MPVEPEDPDDPDEADDPDETTDTRPDRIAAVLLLAFFWPRLLRRVGGKWETRLSALAQGPRPNRHHPGAAWRIRIVKKWRNPSGHITIKEARASVSAYALDRSLAFFLYNHAVERFHALCMRPGGHVKLIFL